MQLIPLTSNNFYIRQGRKGPILCSRVDGLSITLFYSTRCQNCKQLLPVYNSLSQSIRGIQFTALNVGKYRDVAQHSKATITRIEYVPLVIIYVNGTPFMSYDGPKTYENMFSFINGVIQHVTTRRPVSSGPQTRLQRKTEMDQFVERMKKLHGVPYNILDDNYEEIAGAYKNARNSGRNYASINRKDDPSNAYAQQMNRRAGYLGY